jgi:ribosomal protein L44E
MKKEEIIKKKRKGKWDCKASGCDGKINPIGKNALIISRFTMKLHKCIKCGQLHANGKIFKSERVEFLE